jgi:hypothetical protein
LLCTKKEKHSNAEKWGRAITKRATTSEKTGEEKAYHQNYSCEHHMLTAQPNTNIISWNL